MIDARGPCQSCGRESDDLIVVHRVYLTPESWDTPARVDVMPDTESWCFSCRTHYPHEEAGERPET